MYVIIVISYLSLRFLIMSCGAKTGKLRSAVLDSSTVSRDIVQDDSWKKKKKKNSRKEMFSV